MLIVTCANGKLGRLIVENLLKLVPAGRIGVSVRSADKARDLGARGVRVRQADFDDANSVRAAFEGASQVLLVSSNASAFGGDPVAQHRNAIEAARDLGVRRIVYTSHQAASPTSAFGPARDHAATEALLGAAKIPFTALRNGFYSSTVSFILGDAALTGELKVLDDGKVSWTAPADLAEAAAFILADEKRFEGAVTLTASHALNLTEVAAIASEAAGMSVKRTTVSGPEYAASLASRGIPGGAANLLLSIFAASRAHEFDRVDPTLEGLLGRKPMTVREAIEKAATHRT